MREQYMEEFMNTLEGQFPGLDHSTGRMIAVLTNTYHILFAVLERAFAQYGITPQSLDVLVALYVRRDQGCPLGEIGEIMMVSPANVTGLVDGLVRKGLVSRREHPQDRRKRLAEITPNGVKFVEEFIPRSARFLEKVFTPIGEGEKEDLCRQLGQLSKLLMPYWEKRLTCCIKAQEEN